MTIKIALTNLGKYNEGTLMYEWLTLPATEEEIKEAFEAIEVAPNTEYEEHFISDYEAPFKIGEYQSITRLNAVAQVIENTPELTTIIEILKTDEKHDTDKYAGLARSLFDELSFFIEIVHDDQVNEIMKKRVLAGEEWASIRQFTYNADNTNCYHLIDGYANLERLTWHYIDDKISEYLSDLLSDN